MSLPSALDGIIVQLTRRGLPADYAHRAGTEIVDHYRDLVAEQRTAGLDEAAAAAEASRRLGDPRTLIKKTVREYQRRYWCGRWRLTTFLFAPMPLLILLWITTIVIYGVLFLWPLHAIGVLGPETPADGIISTSEWIVVGAIKAWFMLVLPAGIMFGLARLARRAAIGWRWITLSACVLALSACSAKYGFPAPELNHRYMNGAPVPADEPLFTATLVVPGISNVSWAWYRDQFGRILLPFAIAAIVLFRNRQLALRRAQLVLDDC
jgi:hypothetical protein